MSEPERRPLAELLEELVAGARLNAERARLGGSDENHPELGGLHALRCRNYAQAALSLTQAAMTLTRPPRRAS